MQLVNVKNKKAPLFVNNVHVWMDGENDEWMR